MSSARNDAEAVFRDRFTVGPEAIDENGHVNNVVYVQWMQDVAIRHSVATGGTAAMRAAGCTWVARSHQIEYLSPAYLGDAIEAATWVAGIQRVRSCRQYRFTRMSDGKVLAEGATEWVFVNSSSRRPCAIPEAVRRCFTVLPDGGGLPPA